MRILKIELKNINALRGEHKIDFRSEPFKTAGLFAITGATGSGKTTILDVISLALFNQVPRHGKSLSQGYLGSSGAVITRNTREAYAAVIYACDAGVFRSAWSIHITRNNTLGPYHMEVSRDDSGEILPLKKSEVPKKNEELIELTYEQFIRAIVLAQGDFAKFLKSAKDKRNQLLEQITGTEIYRELGIMAFRNAREIENKVKELETVKQNTAGKMRPADEIEDLTIKKQQFEKEVSRLTAALKQLDDKIRIHNELSGFKTKKEEKSKELDRLQTQLETFEKEYGEILKINEKLTPYRDDISNYTRNRAELDQVSEKLQKTEKTGSELLERKIKLLEKGEELGVKSADLENLENKTAAKLNVYTETEKELKRIEKEYREKRKAVAETVNKEPSEISSGYKTVFDRELNRVEKQYLVEKQKIEANNSLPQTIEELENLRDVNLKLQADKKEKKRVEESVAKLTERLNLTDEKLQQLPPQIAKANDKLQNAELQLKTLRQENEIQKLRASLEDHRKRLIDGEPCPLCGAEDHPFAHESEPKKSSEDEVIYKAEKQVKECAGTLQNLNFELSNKTEEKIKIETEINDYNIALRESKNAVNKLNSSLPEDWRKLSDEEKNRVFDERKQVFKNMDLAIRQLEQLKAVLPAVEDLSNLHTVGRKRREELINLYSGENFVQQAEEIIKTARHIREKILTNKTEIKNVKGRFAELKEHHKTLTNKLAKPLEKLGYLQITKAAEDLIPLADLEKIRTRKDTLKQNESSINQTLKHIDEEINLREKTCEQESLEQITAEKNQKETALESYNKELKNTDYLIKQDIENQKEVEYLDKEISTLKTENRGVLTLKAAIGDADGKRFREFAQKLTLNQLTIMANKRLKYLTDRYRLDIPTKNEGEDLVVVDLDMGEARRSATTLSGGETFLVSLALALALSDLAAQTVKIESMFIDEGFGTLDPETLDKTLDVLEKLQAADEKSVGIISHVSALKERITTQIVLTKSGRGYSDLKIRG